MLNIDTNTEKHPQQCELGGQWEYERTGSYNWNIAQAHRLNKLAQANLTNRLLASTCHFVELASNHQQAHYIQSYGNLIEDELSINPDKPSRRLATLATINHLDEKDINLLIAGVSVETTKAQLTEFFTTRENWSTGLRMIDYLNHHVVMEMTRYLPEKDRLDLWQIKPELVNGVAVASSLSQLSPDAQQVILNTITNPKRRERIQKEIKNPIVAPIHFSGTLCGGYINPKTIEVLASFAEIRRRRICSHEDNRRFFLANENFRSCY